MTRPAHQSESETRDVGDAIDSLNRAINVSLLLYMAGESLWSEGQKKSGEAIMVGVDVLRDIMFDVKAVLYANRSKGDDDEVHVVNVGYILLEMLDAYRAAEERINQKQNDACDDDVQRMTDAAFEIIAYRPLTKDDQRCKAEFLKEYTDGTLLTEQEQVALIASLMPEGGAA